MPRKENARLIAVGGGKGGVGKSLIAANVAVAMAEAGASVVLVDADLGAANQHTLLGMNNPGGGLQAFLDHDVETLSEVAVPTGVPRLCVIPGTGAVRGAANITHGQKHRLLRHVRALDADAVIVDVGAGVHYNALDFFDLGNLRLVVMTAQLTSIQNAYSFLKGAVLRALREAATTPEEKTLLDDAVGRRETERVSDALKRLCTEAPHLAETIANVLGGFGAGLVGNQGMSPKDAAVFASVSRMVQQFLNLDLPVLATIPSSRALHDSVNRRRPLVLDDPRDEAARALRRLAEALLASPLRAPQVAAEEPPPRRRRSTIQFGATPETPETPEPVKATAR